MDEITEALLFYYEEGWYYFDEEYMDEGACGPFTSSTEAILHAKWVDYAVKGIDMFWSEV